MEFYIFQAFDFHIDNDIFFLLFIAISDDILRLIVSSLDLITLILN